MKSPKPLNKYVDAVKQMKMTSIPYNPGNPSTALHSTAPLQHCALPGVLKPESSTDLSTGETWEGGPRGTTAPHSQPRAAQECGHVLLRWVSGEGKSRPAMGSGCSGRLGEAAEQHRYC